MITTSRRAPLDSGSMPLEQRKIVKFDPQFNAGTIAQIIVIVASAASIYSGIKSDQAQQRAELDQVKVTAATRESQTKESLADLKLDVKELRSSMQDVKESLAILRGRAAEPRGK